MAEIKMAENGVERAQASSIGNRKTVSTRCGKNLDAKQANQGKA